MADCGIDEATYEAALAELKIAETGHGGVIKPVDWPQSGTPGVWQWLLGPKQQVNDPWNGAVLLEEAKAAVKAGKLRPLDVLVHAHNPEYEPFLGHDIDRNRLPAIIPNLTPGSIAPNMPSSRNRKLMRELEALQWLYGPEYNITHYVAIQIHAKDLLGIIVQLGGIIALRNMLTASTNDHAARIFALCNAAKSASVKRENPVDDDDDDAPKQGGERAKRRR